MSRNLASLVFYARFLPAFSRLGYRRKVRGEPATPGAFAGQRWVVSGASDGIGRAIALGAAAFGARVLALGRNPAKLEALQRDGVGDRIEPVLTELSRVDASRELVTRLAAAGGIDVLVNNVGVMLHEFKRTAEGVETSLATNVLCPFVLAEGLRECGALGAESALISVGSGGMYGARLDLDQLEATSAERHDGFMAYAQHKRAQAELTRYWNQLAAPGPRALLMHPGWVDTDGVKSSLPSFRRRLRALLRSPEQGADTVLWLAQQRPSPSPQGGIWLDRRREDEHAFGFTRGGAASGQLASWLRQRLARINR